LTSLVKKVDTFVKENKKANAAAFLVLMQKDSDESKAKLKKLAKDTQASIPLTINADEGTLKKLKLDSKSKHTVLIWKKQKVTANFPLEEISDKDVEKVISSAKETVASS
jgi:hypothetical protein